MSSRTTVLTPYSFPQQEVFMHEGWQINATNCPPCGRPQQSLQLEAASLEPAWLLGCFLQRPS